MVIKFLETFKSKFSKKVDEKPLNSSRTIVVVFISGKSLEFKQEDVPLEAIKSEKFEKLATWYQGNSVDEVFMLHTGTSISRLKKDNIMFITEFHNESS
jgi:hypothetical protein